MDALIATVIDDKYEVRRLIGRGGMGAVYEGFHLQLQIPVAIKILLTQSMATPESVMRFRSEARFASTLKHPNIVTTMAFGMIENVGPYIVMELLDGKSLAQELDEVKTLPPPRFNKIFSQCCDAFAHVHEQGYVHRDIKPSNIMLVKSADGTESVKITDFGIAKLFGEQSMQALTRTGEIIGTPLYMSPEQCLGNAVDQRTDIYALGCVMYEAFTGTPAFSAETPMQLMMMHVEQSAPYPKQDSALCNVVMHTLEKTPEKRPQSMPELAAELADAAKGFSTFKRKQSLKKFRRIWIAWTAALLLTGLAAFAFLAMKPQARKVADVENYLQAFDRADYVANYSKYDAAIRAAEDDFRDDPKNTVVANNMRAACKLQDKICNWMERYHSPKPAMVEALRRAILIHGLLNQRADLNYTYRGMADTATKLANLCEPGSQAEWDQLYTAHRADDFQEQATEPLCRVLTGDNLFLHEDFENAISQYELALRLTRRQPANDYIRAQFGDYKFDAHLGLFQCALFANNSNEVNKQAGAALEVLKKLSGHHKAEFSLLSETAAFNADHGNLKRAREYLSLLRDDRIFLKNIDSERIALMRGVREYAEGRCAQLEGDANKAREHFAAARKHVEHVASVDVLTRYWIALIQAAPQKETIHKPGL